MKKITFKNISTPDLHFIYTGELWVLKNKTEKEERKILIDCAKHNYLNAETAIDEIRKRKIR